MPGPWCIGFLAVFALRIAGESRVKPRGAETRREKHGKGSLMLLTFSFLISGLAVALYLWRRPEVNPAVYGLGMFLFVAGFAGRILALRTLGRSFSVYIDPAPSEGLRTGGIYGVIRHPLYAFYLVENVGLLLCRPNWVSAAALAVVLPTTFWRIACEERALVTRYGKDYENYRKRTRRLIPGIY